MKFNEVRRFYLPLYAMTTMAAVMPFLIVPFVARTLSVEDFG